MTNLIKISLLSIFLALVIFFTFFDKLETQKKDNITGKKHIITKKYSYRKYLHVKEFYKTIAKKTVQLALKYNVPPAAILAISGVESGYGRGYVASITGNILSLGAKSGEAKLPALYLPNLKKDKSKIIYADDKIKRYKNDELEWKQRPPSLKKDYRPKYIAGTVKELNYFDKHKVKKFNANLKCFEDFSKNWISEKKRLKPFVEARFMLDKQIKLHSKEILFDKELNEKFIRLIGGRKNSFNHRKTWSPKVIKIMNSIGLIELTKQLHVGAKNFDQLW